MTTSRPSELVKSEDYFCGVLINMGHCAKGACAVPKETEVFVRFGTEGKGVHPNYQVETPKGTTRFLGTNHKLFPPSTTIATTRSIFLRSGSTTATSRPCSASVG